MSNQTFRLTELLSYQMSIASNAVSNRIAQVYRDSFGLKVAEWRVMAVLGDAEQATQRELAAITLMDKVAVNRACKVLEQRGLAVRLPNRDDGRSHHLELTADGSVMHQQIVPLVRAVEQQLFAALDAGKKHDFCSLLAAIRTQALENDPES